MSAKRANATAKQPDSALGAKSAANPKTVKSAQNQQNVQNEQGAQVRQNAKSPEGGSNLLDKLFQLRQRGSTVPREIRGGVVTFVAMAYIVILNPSILSAAIPADSNITTEGIAAGTALVAGVMTIVMGLIANFPLAMAAGMGLNATVSYTLCLALGLTYQEAMGLIFWEGVIILLLVLSGFREAVFRAVPRQLKAAISVGIGLFIAFVGLLNAGIIRAGSTVVQLGIDGSLAGWPALVFVIGLILMAVLYVRKVNGAILISIAIATVIAFIMQAFAHLPLLSDDNPMGWGTSIPEFSGSIVSLPDFSTLLQVDFFGAFSELGWLAAVLIIFSLMLADFFDTMGTMVGVGARGDLLDENGNPPRMRSILVIDSLAAVAGGLGGVSSNTSYVESTSGVAEGARTGLAAVTTGVLFLLCTFLAPLASLVPTEAASTALVFVGFLMMLQVTDIDWKDPELALPAFLTIVLMPFAYSITVGIGAGFVFYLMIRIAKGKAAKTHPLIWIMSLLFLVYFALGPIQDLFGVGV